MGAIQQVKGRAHIPAVLQSPGFAFYWFGIALSQIGARAMLTANLWQLLELTDSTLQVGLVGIFDALALFALAPLGGALADRLDRRRVLQSSQTVSLLGAASLALLTLAGVAQPWHIYVVVLAMGAAQTFDGPARLALITSLVPKDRLVDAFALANPTREAAVLVGPAFAGILIAAYGAGTVYAFSAISFLVLIVLLGLLRIPPVEIKVKTSSIWRSIAEGFVFVRERPLIWQLMSLDFSATFFSAYRVLLPSLARDVFLVGASGYGLLAAAPAAGAILGSVVIYRVRALPQKGLLVLAATMAYAVSAMLLAQAPVFILALPAAAGLGVFDAITTTLRHAVVQLETPDHIRGRVTSVYRMVSHGGPSLGQTQMGALATVLGPPFALTLGATVTFAYATWLATRGRTVRRYVS